MSSLSRLAGSVTPGATFSEKFKAKVVDLEQSMHYNTERATGTCVGGTEGYTMAEMNDALRNDIRESGDSFQGRNSSTASIMTRWDMHQTYGSFSLLGDLAIEAAADIPLAIRTFADGSPNPISLYVQESWGLIYNKGHTCKTHTHWPSTWSYTYCVDACEKCAPLCFPTNDGVHPISPKQGQLILFPSWVNHFVPEHECDHERIMISGNLDVDWKK